MKGTEPLLRTVLDVGLSLEKKLHDFFMPLPTGKGQWAILVAVTFNVNLGSVIEKKLGHFLVSGRGQQT